MALDIDRHAQVASSIQRWDPRFKIASLFTLIMCMALIKSIPLVLFSLLVSLTLLFISRIPLDFVYDGMKWVILFLLPFFVILPVTYPGSGESTVLGIAFAEEGLRLATLIVLKAVAIVLIAFAVFGSSRFDVNMIALQRLKCPTVIVQVLLFTYRYIFLFMAEMKRMDTAMKARGFVKGPNVYTLKVMGNFIGTLLIRSFERTERIYKAMLSKGYEGELHTLVEFKSETKDYLKACCAIGVAVLLIIADVAGVFAIAEQAWF